MLYSKIEGNGTPFLIIHGFLGMSDNWKTLANQFAQLGFEVHALDMRNHGKSFHSDEFSYDVMVQDVKEYVDFHQLQNITLLGHSMGGKIAMLFATTYPELISNLIVADIGPKYYAPHHQSILAALNAIDFSQKPSRAEVDEIISTYITDFGTKQFLLKNLYWVEPGQLGFRFNLKIFNEKIEEIGKQLPFENTFNGAVLFLRGDKSDYILDADFETIYYHFPNAVIETVSNAGHWLHAENPSEFFEKVQGFVK
ncbi:alpha/beta fold hydrolase [Flavobacterium urocaniciphilum]|uniref:Pimeloyl-ACP methyl ester carboxylesterase n=1 Tax=Flavobacterium urocaniciphilum TaxID=1299341 RepID=A0A1H9CHJ5_9FLAO|nr:alpha/beta fold hydrolase [Flavobacterium urocaniciphilum]SEQ00639.1 Pimeloyl-ACP methyl ester carboxylesterase [Flavobacterium urocaniciphilum]